MTYDSLVSTSESRVGAFDVHDEDGTYTGEEINLNHNEVAYVRPSKVGSSIPTPRSFRAHQSTGDTVKLRNLNAEVAEARQRQAELAARVERERAEVERLRHLKAQSLAREAAARVHPRPFNTRNVITVRGNTERSLDSSSTGESIYEEEPAKISQIAQRELNNGRVVKTVGNIKVVELAMEMLRGFSASNSIRKIIVGGQQNPTDEDKTILLFGPVGSGKTTTINSMLNYLYDVKRENNFRFVLEAEPTRTTNLTAYVFNNTVLPFNITVVDTPGVPMKQNTDIVSSVIKTWFEQELHEAGTFRLDAISIVLKSEERTLGWPFINELAAVKHMLGDDLKTNVLPIITNSEVLPQPLAVRSLALANITFVEYYKLNNIGFAPVTNEISKLQHNLFFSHAMASLEVYFRDLQELIHPLLAILRGSKPVSITSHADSETHLY